MTAAWMWGSEESLQKRSLLSLWVLRLVSRVRYLLGHLSHRESYIEMGECICCMAFIFTRAVPTVILGRYEKAPTEDSYLVPVGANHSSAYVHTHTSLMSSSE